jgi:hypothetical protein
MAREDLSRFARRSKIGRKGGFMFFDRNYRCFDEDSIDVAARMESICSAIYEAPWSSSSSDSGNSSDWNNDTWSNAGFDEW